MNYIIFFDAFQPSDAPKLGGKNASLGNMITQLKDTAIRIPKGYAITTDGYWHFIAYNHLQKTLTSFHNDFIQLYKQDDIQHLHSKSLELRGIIESGSLPHDLKEEIKHAYQQLSQQYNMQQLDVAVRSSATAEDLPHASFAGQQESFLNINGFEQLQAIYKKCISSLFTLRAITYRLEQQFYSTNVGISVAVQKMVRADKGAAGVIFTLDTETGFKDVIEITASYGLGETVVQGIVNPDEFQVYKPNLEKFKPIIKKQLGAKNKKLIYSTKQKINKPTTLVSVPKSLQQVFSLNDPEIIHLAWQAHIIEKFYSQYYGNWTPMDIEWAKDGIDNQLYIVQARPETVHARKTQYSRITRYEFKQQPDESAKITSGLAVGTAIISGRARIITDITMIDEIQPDEILVTTMTDPNWIPLMKQARAIITDAGGRTSHAAIVSRELGISAVIGTGNGTQAIKNGQVITIDCAHSSIGVIYAGKQAFTKKIFELTQLPQAPAPLLLNISDPDTAFHHSTLPVHGVGLARLEFVISHTIQIHPMAIAHFDQLKPSLKRKILAKTAAYNDPEQFFIRKMAEAIGTIAAAFHPKSVTIRFSDFKTNEYKTLLGGNIFEPDEENPMLGFRGAARFIDPYYRAGFILECQAIKYVQDIMGFSNINAMIPFVRNVEEMADITQIIKQQQLQDTQMFMMCEVPSTVLLLDKFAQYTHGFSIGSNDLTQLILGADRDSTYLSTRYNEKNIAVEQAIKICIKKAHTAQKIITICGQAPAEFDNIAQLVIQQQIDGISLDPHALLPFLLKYGIKQ